MNNIKKLVKDTKTNKNTYFASENIGGGWKFRWRSYS